MFWTTIERLSVQLIQLIIGIILARLLSPTDYGVIGILAVFFAISQTFVDSGMGSALVQKNNRTEKDYSTVFVFNLITSIVIYLILFVAAPFIANFFNIDQLTVLTRVLSVSIIISSLAIVQRTRLTIKLNFKSIAKVNFLATFLSGIIAIYTAYIGLGVWALVVRQLLSVLLKTILFWMISHWRVSLLFYKESFKELFGFGSKLLLAGLYTQVLNNMYNLAIGKRFPAAELGYYERSKFFSDLTSGTISDILQQVTFPILASVNNDKERMVSIYRRVIQLTSFVVIPAMTLLSLLAQPFISIALGEKWLGVIPLLQWMAFARVFYPISSINMSILKAMGRSDLFLKLDLSKFPLFVIALLISIPIGVKAMVISQVIISFIAFFMNAYLPGKFFGYGAWGQLKDMFPVILATCVMAVLTYFTVSFIDIESFKLLIGVLVAIISFLGMAVLLKIKALEMIIEEVNTFRSK